MEMGAGVALGDMETEKVGKEAEIYWGQKEILVHGKSSGRRNRSTGKLKERRIKKGAR